MDRNETDKKVVSVWVMGCADSEQCATRVCLLAKRIHGGHYDRPCVMYKRLEPSDLYAYSQHGYKAEELRGMKYKYATDNQELAQDIYAWHKARALINSWPYWVAAGIAYIIGWHRGSFANSINNTTREK